MSKTKRIYNKYPIGGGPGFKGWVKTQIRDEMLGKNPSKSYNESLRPEDNIEISRCPWITYHPYKQLCCGNCPSCKDRGKNKRERMNRKIELRNRIKEIQCMSYVGDGCRTSYGFNDGCLHYFI